jgi:hypothetical protein
MSIPTFAILPDGDGRSTAFGFERAGEGYVRMQWLVSDDAARLIARAEALAQSFQTVSELLEARLRGEGDEAVFERLQDARHALELAPAAFT